MQEADLSHVAGECWKGAEGTSGVLMLVASWPGGRCLKQPLLENRKIEEMKGTRLYALVRERCFGDPGNTQPVPSDVLQRSPQDIHSSPCLPPLEDTIPTSSSPLRHLMRMDWLLTSRCLLKALSTWSFPQRSSPSTCLRPKC